MTQRSIILAFDFDGVMHPVDSRTESKFYRLGLLKAAAWASLAAETFHRAIEASKHSVLRSRIPTVAGTRRRILQV
ncbi:MAG: hypothetical protein H7Y19_14505 [Luteimonas sp.]|nr:hypothetical protein [Luteimonas sp.]